MNEEKPTIKRGLFNRISPVTLGAMIVLVLALGGVIAWNVQLSLSVNNQASTLAEQSRFMQAIAAGTEVHHISGIDANSAAKVVLVQEPGSEQAYLVVKGLPSLPAWMEYQVWLIGGEGSTPLGAGTFIVNDPAGQLITVAADFSSADALGISVEPKGGSPAPPGEIDVLSEL
jgi:anti-sigma-K factor RskA